MRILGISCFYHNAAACILEDGKVIAAAEEERFSRVKHDARFPRRAIAYCLEEAGIQMKDIDCVAFYDVPFLTFERILETTLAAAPRGLRQYLAAMPEWLTRKLWMRAYLARELGVRDIRFFPHHISHAASAFFPSPFEDAAIIVADGVGEWATLSWGVGEGNEIELKEEIRFPHSLGLLYSAFTEYLGFMVNSDEYKVMGLAPYGEPRFLSEIEKIAHSKQDGSLHLDMRYFDFVGGSSMTSAAFHKLFGGTPCASGSPITQREKDIATSIQKFTEDHMLRVARMVKEKTGKKNLCMAGGVALNCVANGKLLESKLFENIWVQPAAGDAGGALGAALAAYYEEGAVRRNANDLQQGSFLGPSFSREVIESFLIKNHIPYTEPESVAMRLADHLADGRIIGYFTGRMEFGPRALGARSILADPRKPHMRDRLNAVIKNRESFRPFAPAVLEEKAREYFEIEQQSPFMLFTFKARSGVTDIVPSAIHVDGSARVQTVAAGELLRPVLEAFFERTGCPVLINTSMNGNGEPIVCTPEEAYDFFVRSDLDVLALGPFLIESKPERVDVAPLPLAVRHRLALLFPSSVSEALFETGSMIAAVLGTVLLAVVFYTVLTPIGLVMRLVYDPLGRRSGARWTAVDSQFAKGKSVS